MQKQHTISFLCKKCYYQDNWSNIHVFKDRQFKLKISLVTFIQFRDFFRFQAVQRPPCEYVLMRCKRKLMHLKRKLFRVSLHQ